MFYGNGTNVGVTCLGAEKLWIGQTSDQIEVKYRSVKKCSNFVRNLFQSNDYLNSKTNITIKKP